MTDVTRLCVVEFSNGNFHRKCQNIIASAVEWSVRPRVRVVLVFTVLIPKNMRGWWRWALVGPDGVEPTRMVSVSASVDLPLHHRVQKFSSGTGSPGWSRKKSRKRLWWWWLSQNNNNPVCNAPDASVTDPEAWRTLRNITVRVDH